MQYTGRPHGGEGRGPSDEDGLWASNIFESGSQLASNVELIGELLQVGSILLGRACGVLFRIDDVVNERGVSVMVQRHVPHLFLPRVYLQSLTCCVPLMVELYLCVPFITDKYFYVVRVESPNNTPLILLNSFLYASGRNVVYKFTAPRRKPVIGANAVSPSTGTLSNVSAILAHFPSLPHLALLSRRRRRW